MNQLVTLSFYTAPITPPPHNSNMGASGRDGAEGLIVDDMREVADFGHLLVSVAQGRLYTVVLFLWEEIIVDMQIPHPEQLSGGSRLSKLQHAHTL